MFEYTVIPGDACEVMRTMESESVHCCVTSPPYWQKRDYRVDGQIGLEKTPEEYVDKIVAVFDQIHRVLRKDGTCWLVIGDTYTGGGKSGSGLKRMNLVGIPWRIAFALQKREWYLRSEIIWEKQQPMPESAKSRPSSSHETIFLLTKSERYFYDHEAVQVPTVGFCFSDRPPKTNGMHPNLHQIQPKPYRALRDVWTFAGRQFSGDHHAVFPWDIPDRCIRAGCPKDGVVLDPFAGAGTTLLAARRLGRRSIGIELSPKYVEMIHNRLADDMPLAIENLRTEEVGLLEIKESR